MSVASRLLSGLGWSALSQGVRIFLQLASIPILSRLLHPSDFGIYAMCVPVLGLAGLLQDFGLQQALVQKEKLSHKQMNSVFWINFLISISVAASMFFLSGSVARFFSEPSLEGLIAAFSLITFLGAAGFGQYALLNRELRFRAIALIDMTCAIVSFIVVISCAVHFRSFWALWAGAFSSVICWIFLSYAVASWRPGLPSFGVNLDGMFRFGFHIVIHNFAIYFTRNFDSILIGKFIGSNALGLYDRAYKILLFPIENLAQPISRVMVPMLSRMRGDPEHFRSVFVVVNGLLHLACIPALAALIGCSDQFVLFLLGENFSGVSPIFFWLGFAGLVQPLLIASHWVLIAEGRSEMLMKVSITSAFFISLSFVIGLNWGVVGIAAAYACAEVLLRAPVTVWLAGRAGVIKHDIFLRNIMPVAFSAAVTLGFAQLLADYTSGLTLLVSTIFFAYISAFSCLALFPNGRALLSRIKRIKSLWGDRHTIEDDGFNKPLLP
jgi:PST family polysaccharide transporter